MGGFQNTIASSEIAQTVGSYLSCHTILSLTTSSRDLKALGLETGLLTICIKDLSNDRDIQNFIKFVTKCTSLLHLDMSCPCEPTDMVVQEIVGHYKHLLSIDLKECRFVSDQAVQTLAQHCPKLVKICIGATYPKVPDISDAAVLAIARSCRQLEAIDLDDTACTDDGAQVLASSCERLQYASVGGTYVTTVGAVALAQRCTLASASGGRPMFIFPLYYNLGLYRLGDSVDVQSLSTRFPTISILG